MQEIKLKHISAILTADWHLRENTPTCRTDDFWKAQWRKVIEIKKLQKKLNCPVIHAGDLFDNWKPSPFLLSKTIRYIPDKFYTIYGNHDLPQHSIELQMKSGIYTLYTANKLHLLPGCHWLNIPNFERDCFKIENKKILIWHIMTYQGKSFPGCIDKPARNLIRKYKDYDLILTGHNHKSFVETYENRLLINPGSITRQSAIQINHKPKVYLYDAINNEYQEYILQHRKNVISVEHLEEIEERENRLDAFITKLNTDWQIEMNFETNIETFFKMNKNIDKEVKELIYEAISIE